MNPSTLNGIAGLVGSFAPIIDEMFTTPEERSNAKLKLLELAHRGELAQLAVNSEEAKHSSLFVSGWRPFVGWTCAVALCLSFIVFPIIQSYFIYYTAFTDEVIDLSGLPKFDWSVLAPVLMGMLGLGALRTAEKMTGVARK